MVPRSRSGSLSLQTEKRIDVFCDTSSVRIQCRVANRLKPHDKSTENRLYTNCHPLASRWFCCSTYFAPYFFRLRFITNVQDVDHETSDTPLGTLEGGSQRLSFPHSSSCLHESVVVAEVARRSIVPRTFERVANSPIIFETNHPIARG